jgi:hypothetical protein
VLATAPRLVPAGASLAAMASPQLKDGDRPARRPGAAIQAKAGHDRALACKSAAHPFLVGGAAAGATQAPGGRCG